MNSLTINGASLYEGSMRYIGVLAFYNGIERCLTTIATQVTPLLSEAADSWMRVASQLRDFVDAISPDV